VKFFSQNRFTRALRLLFATYPNLAATAATRPLNAKRRQDFSCNIRLSEVVKVVIKIFTAHSRIVAIIGITSLYRQPEIKNFAFG